MRRKRTHLLPIERRIIAMQYRDRVPVREIMTRHNCVLTTVLTAARYEGMVVPRPKPPRKTKPRPRKPQNVAAGPATYLPQK